MGQMSKPNIVNFSDFHAHIFQDFSKPSENYVTDRFEEQLTVLKSVLDYAQEHDADVLFNGDLFHKRTVVDVRVFNPVYEIFQSYPDLTVYLLRGNHDSVTNSMYTESALEPFSALPNVKVISEMEKIITPYYTLYGVPYGEEVAEMKQWIAEQAKQLSTGTFNILCAHIGVNGATTGKYSHTLDGAFTVEDLWYKAFDLVTLGHYHKRQHLAQLPNVFYVGNTLQTSFADEGMDKGFYYIAIDGSKFTLDFIKTDYTPFITINAENAPEDLGNAYYQFVGNVAEAKAVIAVKEEQNLSNIRVNVKKDFAIPPRIDIKAGSTPEEVVKAFTDKTFPDLEKKAFECLREAMESR